MSIRAQLLAESTAALAANGVYTGTGHAIGSPEGVASFAYYRAFAFSDQAGTLEVDVSFDSGATWQKAASQAVAANAAAATAVPLCGPPGVQYRTVYTNGATLQGVFRCASSFTAA